MPKLLQINVCNNCFSTGTIVSEIGELAITHGWESYVAYGRNTFPDKNHQIKIGHKIDNIIHGIETRIFDNHALGLSSRFSTYKLINIIKKIAPDVIHLHVTSGYYLNLKVLFGYLSKSNIPIVWTIHSCWEFTGHCTHFDYINCHKWMTECYDCPLYKEYPESLWIDRSRTNFREKKRIFTNIKDVTIVSVSQWLSEQIKKSFLSVHENITIYNGIDTNFFRPLKDIKKLKNTLSIPNKTILLALASKWTPKKGINDYIELANKLDSSNYALYMVGFDGSGYRNLPSCITPVSVTTERTLLLQYYNVADIVLNLSYEESFGLTTVEGMACGTPCIVYNRTASPELVSDTTGVVVNAGDIDALAEAVFEIEKKGKQYYSEACRSRAVSLFDKQTNYMEYIKLYKMKNIENQTV